MTDFKKPKEQILQTLPTELVWRAPPEMPIERHSVLAVFMQKDGTVFWKRSSWTTSLGGKIIWLGGPQYSRPDGGYDIPEPIAWAYVRINEVTKHG